MKMPGCRQRKGKQNGMATVEVTLGLCFFITVILCIIELSFLGYISALADYALSESSRAARQIAKGSSHAVFRTIIENRDSIWSHFLEKDRFKLETFFYKDLAELNNDKCACSGSTSQIGRPVVVYRLSYDYQPLFIFSVLQEYGTATITRESVTVLEYDYE